MRDVRMKKRNGNVNRLLTDGSEVVDGSDGGSEGEVRLGEEEQQQCRALSGAAQQREGSQTCAGLWADQFHHP